MRKIIGLKEIFLKEMTRRNFLRLSMLGTAFFAFYKGSEKSNLHAEKKKNYDVVIIGGGLSGLVAAYNLRKYNILLIEKYKEPGGRIRYEKWGDLGFSLGASYMEEPTDYMMKFFNELKIKPVAVPSPTDAVAYNGRIYSDKAISFLGTKKAYKDFIKFSRTVIELNDEGVEDAVFEGVKALSNFEELDKISMKDWLDKMGIDPKVQNYINVENRGLFGASNEDLSLLFDIPEMAYNFDLEDASVDDWDDITVEEENDFSGGKADLYTFKHGMIEIVWAIQKKLNDKIISGAEVTNVMVNSDKTVTIVYKKDGKSEEIKASSAILATPAPVTARIVKKGFSEKVLNALRSIYYSSYVTIAIFLSQRIWNKSWNISCLDTPFSTLNDAIRSQMPKDYKDKGILGVALPPLAARDKKFYKMSDKEVMALVLKEIERYFPDIRKKTVGQFINRFEYGFPVFEPEYSKILNTIYTDTSVLGPLFLAGDYLMYPTLGGAVESGNNASDAVFDYFEE